MGKTSTFNRIHIVGVSARSGTTLMAECMRICFDIDAFEPHESPLWKMRRDASIYLTKRPNDIMYLGARLALDPRLTIICMMRDPRDVIVSKHQIRPDQYFTSLGRWKYRLRFVEKYTHHPRFIIVKYEDFIRDPDGTQAFLLSKIPFLKKKRDFSEFHQSSDISKGSAKALGGLRPIDARNIANWKNHLPRLVEQINRYGGIDSDLIRYHYETDSEWAKELSGVEPLKGHPKDKRVSKNLKHYYVTYPLGAVAAYFSYLLSLRYI